LYPNLSISWAGNRDRLQSGSDAAVSGFSIGYGLTLSLPVLDGGRIRSNIAVQDARVLEAQAE
jgi:multidrug efflux system outer membrane protein